MTAFSWKTLHPTATSIQFDFQASISPRMSFDVRQKMKKHFPRLRQLLKAFAVIGPVVISAAFIGFAYGLIGLSLAFGFAFLGLLLIFPIELFANFRDPKSKSDPFKLHTRAGTLIFILWLIRVPEFIAFLEKLSEKGILINFLPICAGFIWTLDAIQKGLRSINDLGDQDIYRFISGELVSRTHQTEQAGSSHGDKPLC